MITNFCAFRLATVAHRKHWHDSQSSHGSSHISAYILAPSPAPGLFVRDGAHPFRSVLPPFFGIQ